MNWKEWFTGIAEAGGRNNWSQKVCVEEIRYQAFAERFCEEHHVGNERLGIEKNQYEK